MLGVGSRFTVTLNGVPLTSLMLDDLLEVTVNTSLHMPPMFTLRFQDEETLGAYKWIDTPVFPIGGLVTITAISDTESVSVPTPGLLITGEITSLEANFAADGTATLIVRGYHKSHRLNRGKKTATYLMMNDSAIVAKVCASAGVPVTPTPTAVIHEYVLQNNQTDMEFLQARAKRVGYRLAVNNDTGMLTFAKQELPGGAPGPLLTWEKELYSFQPRETAAGQVSSVSVQGYDPKTKLPIQSLLPVPPLLPYGGAMPKADLALSRTVFGATSMEVVTDKNPDMIPEAAALAQGKTGEINMRFLQADGVCQGHPRVQAGNMVTIMGVGTKYSGPYLVSAATHVFGANGVYETHFSITGTEPDTIRDLLDKTETPESLGLVKGVAIGLVTNNLDPLGLGRVKVKFPWRGSVPPVESAWCRIATPMAGPQMAGFYFIPDINEEVLVAFEHGDVNHPYIVGSLWNNIDRPPLPSAGVVVGGKVVKRIIKSRSGHQIILDDTPGKESITIQDKSMGNKLVIDTTQKSLTINVLGNCEINATADVKIGSMTKDVSIECTNFNVKAKANCKIEAMANLDLKATAQTKIEGTAGVMMKAAVAQVALQGPSVNINNGALEVI